MKINASTEGGLRIDEMTEAKLLRSGLLKADFAIVDDGMIEGIVARISL